MKPKYEKMIDEYVKKHYGDLERGVLAPEVKYKVLFKIYRKKYKKARETAKVLSDVVYSWHIKNDSEGEAPSPDKVLLKEKAQDSYLDWLHDDITWCCRECSNMNCERNSRNRRCKEGLYSVADMYDPFKCPVDAEMPKQP